MKGKESKLLYISAMQLCAKVNCKEDACIQNKV